MARAIGLGGMTAALALAWFGTGGPAVAQSLSQGSPSVSRPVVQSLPGRDGMALDSALVRLARDPRDIAALIDAGNAALAMGDIEAATGFFRRADQVAPGNPRVKAGLAGAMVRNGDPFDAIPLFDDAEKAGALDGSSAADRGLAYDLVGDNATAQRYYRQSLARMPSDEAVRRLALSLAIAGDKHNAELILSPLLSQRDLAAWRTRAFALAILGQTDEAVSIANTILPAQLASGIAPYLRYMPRLTRAQQAAAANFGAFPRASEIGRDDPRVAQYAPRRGSGVAAADTALMPQGEPLGRKGRTRERDRDRSASRQDTARVAVAAPSASTPLLPSASLQRPASPQRTVRAAPPEPPRPTREAALAVAVPQPVPMAAPRAAPVAMAPAPMPAPAPTPAPAPPSPPPRMAMVDSPPLPGPVSASVTAPQTAQVLPGMAAATPGFTLAPSAPPSVPSPSAPLAAPVQASPVPPPPPPPRGLTEAFAEFLRPSTDVTPAAGAVDLRRIKPARPEPKKPAEPPKPPPPSHPSRIWVQVATGRDKAALAFDWRRMTREHADTFRAKTPFVSAWGQTNRLLTGPFQSETAANSYIAQLRRADIDGAFVWTSPAGQVVDGLPVAAPRR